MGEIRKAIEYYEEALKISRVIGDMRSEGNHLSNLGSATSVLGEARKAIEFHEQSLKIAREISETNGVKEDAWATWALPTPIWVMFVRPSNIMSRH